MATTTKALARGAFTTSNANLYVVPASTTAVITNIAITNTASSSATFNLALNGTSLHTTTTIAANTTVYIDMKQVVTATQGVAGYASAITVNYHISGVEIA